MLDDNALPEHWEVKKLIEVAEVGPKIPGRETISDDLEVQFLPMKLVEEENGKIHLTESRKYGEVKKGYTPFINGDVIFAKVTPCMENGKIAVVENLKNEIGFGSSEFHVIRSKGKISNRYLFYFLVQQQVRREAEREMTGAVGLRRVPKKFLENYLIPLPPTTEQEAIVAKLEELFSELDNGKYQLETARQQLKVYRQAVLKWAFEGRLTNPKVKEGELPEGWKLIEIKEVAEINPKIPNREKIEDDLEVQFIPMKLVEEVIGKVHLAETRKYSEVKKGYTAFVNKDVIFAKVTPCMENGKIAVVNNLLNGIGFGSTEFHVIRANPGLNNQYLFHFLVQERFRKEAGNEMTGAVGLRRVPKQFIEKYVIPLPPLKEQIQIVQEVESRLSVCDKVEETINQSLQQAETLRQSILKQAFEGRLVKKTSKNFI